MDASRQSLLGLVTRVNAASPDQAEHTERNVLVKGVGRRGLEPLTPCASCKCATNCANGPFDRIVSLTYQPTAWPNKR